MKVAVATHNAHKVREIAQILRIDDWELVPISELGLTTLPPETASTFMGNALIKARAAHAATGLPALADDSGLEVDALDGAPGVYSARYAGHDANAAANNAKLLAALASTPQPQRTARFTCTVAYIDAAGRETCATGTCEGQIATAPRGHEGFGYDPLFLPMQYHGNYTMAELSAADKNAISHRAAALTNLRKELAILDD
jgi:XTP/dITP diphosphohydrolase